VRQEVAVAGATVVQMNTIQDQRIESKGAFKFRRSNVEKASFSQKTPTKKDPLTKLKTNCSYHLLDSGVGCWRGAASDALRMCLHVAL
jgi:hypothetical protein